LRVRSKLTRAFETALNDAAKFVDIPKAPEAEVENVPAMQTLRNTRRNPG
jgi:hypothetical protein